MDLRLRGFGGFAPVSVLRDRAAPAPQSSGVYAVLRVDHRSPRFLELNPGSHFQRKDPTVSVGRLREEWVDGAHTLYIGGAQDLCDRIRLLIEFSHAGPDRSVSHWGGRFLWQVAASDEFEVVWETTPSDQFRLLEQRLVDEFANGWGQLPFANLRRPPGR